MDTVQSRISLGFGGIRAEWNDHAFLVTVAACVERHQNNADGERTRSNEGASSHAACETGAVHQPDTTSYARMMLRAFHHRVYRTCR